MKHFLLKNIEKMRIRVSRLFAAAVILLLCLGESAWDTGCHTLTTIMLAVSIFLVAAATLGRLWCSLYIAGYKTDRLVTLGPYSMSRNPLYFFSFLGALGIGLNSETFIIPLIILLAFWCYYPLVIKSEEKEMLRRHRQAFERYRAKVPMFFPNISLLTEPELYPVRPILFKKHIFDVVWFSGFMGIIEIIEECHRLNVLPVMFRLY